MAVDDLWYLKERGPNGERLKSKRHGRGKRYRVRWVDDNGQPRAQLFERKADAERHDANVRADLSRGQYIDPAAGKTTVETYGEAWRVAQLHNGNTADSVRRSLQVHIYPYLGRMQLRQVRRSHIQAWVKGRAKVLAPSSTRLMYHILAGMFSAAVLDRKIGASPCLDIKLPDVDHGGRFIPTPQQVHALAAALPAHLRALVYLAAGCGHRQGEAWAVELEHVDFGRQEISIVQQTCICRRQPTHLAAPKTVTSRRTVEMGQLVVEALQWHIERFPPKPVEILDETDPRKPVVRKARLLFLNSRGTPMRQWSWVDPWAAAVRATSGLPDGFGYHGLRHYYATLLIHGGANVKTVQLALGHARPSTTLDMYVHEWPDAIDRTRNLVDAELGQHLPPSATR